MEAGRTLGKAEKVLEKGGPFLVLLPERVILII